MRSGISLRQLQIGPQDRGRKETRPRATRPGGQTPRCSVCDRAPTGCRGVCPPSSNTFCPRSVSARGFGYARGCGAMGTATFSFFERHHSPPRAGFMAYMPPSILSGTVDLSSHSAAASSPVAGLARTGAALHPALPLKTPLERDPFVERSERKIHTPEAAGISPPTVNYCHPGISRSEISGTQGDV
jgi:hypothetical protein